MNSKKHFKFISVALVISIFMSVILLLPFAKVNADASVSIYISGTAEVGKTINVSLSISGPETAYAGFSGGFVYNSSLLRLDSISSNYSLQAKSEAMGTFSSTGGLSIPSGSTIITGTFTCLAEGSTTISLSDFEVDAKYSGASANLTITTPVPKSDNPNLASLKVSPGTLSPSFAWSTTSYSMEVGEDITKVSVTAVAEHNKAKVSLNGVQNNIKPGTNTIKVTVTAENGNTKVYSISVTRASGPTGTPTPTPKPLPLVKYLENELMIIPIDDNTTIPEGFSTTTSTYKGVEIPVFKGPASAGSTDEILLVQLLTAQKVKLFVYDPAEQIVYPLLFIAQEETSLRLLDAGDSIQAPQGYEKFVFEYDGEPVNAYRLISDPTHPQILLYMMDAEGKEVFYYFDTEHEMLMPYRGETVLLDPTVTPTPSPDPAAATTEAPVTGVSAPSETQPTIKNRNTLLENLSDFKSPFTIMFYLVALIALVLAAAVISLIIGRKSDYEEDYDEDYLPEDETIPPLAVYPTGSSKRIQDPDDVFEENFNKQRNQAEGDYIPSIVRTPTLEKPVNQQAQPPQPPVGLRDTSRPVADAVSVMGVRKVQLSSIPELAEPAIVSAQPVTPQQPPKVENPIPEHIPVRLKLELDEQMNKSSVASQAKVIADPPSKGTENLTTKSPTVTPEKSIPDVKIPSANPEKAPSNMDAPPVGKTTPAPPVGKTPPTPPPAPTVGKTPPTPAHPVMPSDSDFGFKYVPGNIQKEPTAPTKESPSLEFPDIRRKSETPADPDLE